MARPGAGTTLHEVLWSVAESAPGQPAVSGGTEWSTYGELAREADAVAGGLRAAGLAEGEAVALVLPSGPRAVTAFFGTLRAGGVAVLLSPALRPRELGEVVADLRPALVVTAGPAPGHDLPARSLDDVIGLGAGLGARPLPAVQPAATATIVYTTGTTGRPKGVLHSHAGLLASFLALDQLHDRFLGGTPLEVAARVTSVVRRFGGRMLRGLGPRTWLTPLPLHSIAGFRVALQALLSGQRLLLMERFHPRVAMDLIARERVSILAATPAMVEAMLSVGGDHDVSSLLVVGLGSAPTPPELARRARARFGCPVLIGYGTTETGGGVLVTQVHDSDERQAETVGLPFPNAEVRIVDEQRRPVPAGTRGELACRAGGLMTGYRGDPGDASGVVDAEGWYYTGDLAVMDEDGYVRIAGRKRDLIIRGGHNVVPAELERVLEEHPEVARAGVVGVADRVAGERIMAFVVPRSAALDAAEVRAHCARRLAPHKVPDLLRVVADLPLAASGELSRAALRRLADTEDGVPRAVSNDTGTGS